MKPLIGVTPDFNAGDRKEWGGREPTYFLARSLHSRDRRPGRHPFVLPLVADLAPDAACSTSHRWTPADRQWSRSRTVSSMANANATSFRVMSQRRATFELEMAQLARTAICRCLGICGGMQAINVAFGGSLYQDIRSQLPHPLQHRQPAPATQLSHPSSHSEKPAASDRQDR